MTHQLEITRQFRASVNAVYDAWTKPELFSQWMGPGNVTCDKIESDLVPGGKYEIHMQTEMGVKIAFGVYQEIIPNEKLSFSWAWKDGDFTDSHVIIYFKSIDDGTELKLQHTKLPTETSAGHHTEGWEGSLGKLSAFLKACSP